MSTIFLVVWSGWWLSGLAFALWAWATEFGKVEVSAAVVATIACVALGPVVGLLWWPSDSSLRRRKR